MREEIELKHNTCGAIIRIVPVENMEKGFIECPICEKRRPFSEYSFHNSSEQAPHARQGEDTDGTDNTTSGIGFSHHSNTPGSLLFTPPTLPPVVLQEGSNIIGRASKGSTAEIQIPINNDSKHTSREHLKIEVKNIAGMGYVHYVTLCKERVNTTYLNSKPMKYGDCHILKDGDILRLPDVKITFNLTDDNETTI